MTINDKRRIDPDTGELRSSGGFFSSPFGRKSDPGDPEEAAQPLPVQTDADLALEAAKQEAAERTADLQRVTAEYANYRKRVDRDRELVVRNAKASVLTEMLTVLDDIDRADRHGDLTGAFKAVADRLIGILTKAGLTQFGAVGDEFDPARHEAVQFATASDVSVQTVTTVMRHGYSLGDKLVRPAVVGVTGPGDDESAGAGDDQSADEPADAGGVDDVIDAEIVDEPVEEQK
ncbi:nucleotide exchange factor GrpE [Nakamurella panacisegetis]|uniref:nucleotide exchange factor GrpE n=1 Tax=Nakamurella panacisegetis TaxID=1090615 RepID=UPI001E3EED3F|nr:nucleotide exchange factor GrpE [Nakamurella panacisegetis]